MSFELNAQCPNFSWYPTTVPGVCCPTNVVNGQVLNSGSYCFNGSALFSSGLTINSADLTICGSLTLGNLTLGDNLGATIYVRPGATLILNGNLLIQRQCFIVNYGTIVINGNVDLTPYAAYIYNAVGAVFSLPNSGNTLTINGSSWFNNFGTANINTLVTTGSTISGCLCLGAGSALNTVQFNNNFYNSIDIYGSGSVCIYNSSNLNLTNSLLTTEPNVTLCQPASASITTSSGGAIGSAFLNKPCIGCSVALNKIISSFKGVENHGRINLNWNLNSCYSIEKVNINVLNNNGVILQSATYNCSLNQEVVIENSSYSNGIVFFELELLNVDNQVMDSSIISISNTEKIEVSPNPCMDKIYIDFNGLSDSNFSFILFNMSGEIFELNDLQVDSNGSTYFKVDLQNGVYFLSDLNQELLKPIKIIKF